MFKQLVFTAAMLGAAFAHCAASNDQSKQRVLNSNQPAHDNRFNDIYAVVGAAHNKRGRSVTLTLPLAPDIYTVFFIYSEHPEVTKGETLEKIASQYIRREIIPNTYENLNDEFDRVSQQIEATLLNIVKKQSPSSLVPENIYTCACLSITLNKKWIECFQLYIRPSDKEMPVFTSSGLFPVVTENVPIDRHYCSGNANPFGGFTWGFRSINGADAQAKARTLQHENPESPFHFIIDDQKMARNMRRFLRGKKMNTKQLIITAAMLGAAFAHGAASNDQTQQVVPYAKQGTHNNKKKARNNKKDEFDFIGLSHSNRGKLSATMKFLSPEKDTCSLLVVYSEDPEIMNPSVMADITEKFASGSHRTFYKTFKSIVSEYFTTENVEHDNESLALELCREKLITVSMHFSKTDTPLKRSYKIDTSGKAYHTNYTHKLFCFNDLITYERSLRETAKRFVWLSAQETADDLQEKYPERPFHLAIDCDSWQYPPHSDQKQISLRYGSCSIALKSDTKRTLSSGASGETEYEYKKLTIGSQQNAATPRLQQSGNSLCTITLPQ